MKLAKILLGLAMIMVMPLYVSAQNITVKGVVTDDAGLAVIGVSVVQQGTQNGVITDVDGNYSISIPSNSTIVFSSIGYKDEVVSVAGRTSINIVLHEDNELLDEIVVVGYGVQKKSDVTGSVASVDTDQMMKRTPTNIVQGLQGAAAGVVITQSSGDPTGGYSIRIRGVATMNGDTNPLWVVDGVQYGTASNLSWLDPQDVESIEVLKDASATAIYGARGANGVIMVTTKKGKSGEARVDFKADFGVSTYTNRLEVASLQDWLGAYRQSLVTDGKTGFAAYTGAYDSQLNEIDWQDVMTQTSFRQQYSIRISGGSDAAKNSVSIGYLDNKGIIVNSWDKRLNIRINSDFNITKWLKAGASMAFNTQKGHGGGNMMSYSRTLPTMDYIDSKGQLIHMPVVFDDGTYGHYSFENDCREGPGIYATNPYASQTLKRFGEDWDNDNGGLRSAAWVEVTIAKGLIFRSNLNYDFSASNSWDYSPSFINNQDTYSAYKNSAPLDSFSTNGSASTNLGAENFITYNKNFGAHTITAMVGQSASKSHGSWNNSSTSDLTFPFLRGFFSTDKTSYNNGDGGPNISSRFLSYFARFNYSFDSRYLLTATVRRDGSSNFGRDNRWGTFPSFSFAWNVSRESWMKNVSWLDTFKVRAGWGETGNANVSPTASVPQLSSSGSSFDTFDDNRDYRQNVGIVQTKEIDTGLQWETSVQSNVGIDLGFMKNSLTFSADYYIRDTRDLILDKSIRPSAGFTNITTNFGSIRNSGFEFALGYKKQINQDWFFSASATASTNKNKAIDIGAGTTISGDKGSGWEDRQVCYNGLPLGTYFGYAVDHIIKDKAEIDALNARAVEIYGKGSYYDRQYTAPGDYLYKDLNGDGHITADDKYYMGDGFVKLNYGLNLSASYRNWDASMYLYGALGQKILSWSKCYLTNISNNNEGYFNMLSEVATGSWTNENKDAKYPRISRDDMSGNKRISDVFIEKGDYLKISNLQIGYNINTDFLGKTIRNARVYGSIQNLLTLSPYTKYGDPEVSSGVTTTGYDGGRYPFPRTFMFGIQFGM